MYNIYTQLRELFAGPPLLVATVVSSSGSVTTVSLAGGGTLHVHGTAAPGASVYVRGGVIEGLAPAMTAHVIDI